MGGEWRRTAWGRGGGVTTPAGQKRARCVTGAAPPAVFMVTPGPSPPPPPPAGCGHLSNRPALKGSPG